MRRTLVLWWVVSLFVAADLASTVTLAQMRMPPMMLSGPDIGFRVEGFNRGGCRPARSWCGWVESGSRWEQPQESIRSSSASVQAVTSPGGPCERSTWNAAWQSVDAESPRAARGDEQEDEAEKDCRLAAVLNRPRSTGLMRQEVGKRHLTACDERGRHGEKSGYHERAADDLDDSGQAESRHQVDLLAAQHAELLQTMTEKKQPGDDAEGGVGEGFELRQHSNLHAADYIVSNAMAGSIAQLTEP